MAQGKIDRDGPVPVYMQVAAQIRQAIRTGYLGPGARLPSESELMAEYGIARLTARKAIRVLAAEGLVDVVAGRGSWVRAAL